MQKQFWSNEMSKKIGHIKVTIEGDLEIKNATVDEVADEQRK